MLTCPNCKAEFEDGALFCAECGTRLESPAPQPAPQAAPQPAPQPAPQAAPQFVYAQPAEAPAEKKKHPKQGAAVCSLIFGILSWLCCGLNLIFAIVGLATGSSALKAAPSGMAKAGKILSIITLIISIVGLVISIVTLIIAMVGGATMSGGEFGEIIEELLWELGLY